MHSQKVPSTPDYHALCTPCELRLSNDRNQRSSNDCTVQIAYATVAGDVVVASAYAHELPEFGLKVGLNNFAAAYCTGLLLARRTLSKYGLADTYKVCPIPPTSHWRGFCLQIVVVGY